MRKVSLFSGIGGIDLAAHWAGMETVLFCEREPFAQKVLQKHWPDVPIIDDVHNVTREELDRLGIGTIDALSAGFPCQPASLAGKREGTNDDRWLWPQVVRVLTELEPTWFIGENVAGLLSMAEPDGPAIVESRTIIRSPEEDLYDALFTQEEIMLIGNIIKNLESISYEVQVVVIPAAAVDAKNLRERIFILGYSERGRLSGKSRRRTEKKPSNGHRGVESGAVADTASEGLPLGGRPGGCESNTEAGGRTNPGLERRGIVADAYEQYGNDGGHGASEICWERESTELSGSQNVAYSEGERCRHGDDSENVRSSDREIDASSDAGSSTNANVADSYSKREPQSSGHVGEVRGWIVDGCKTMVDPDSERREKLNSTGEPGAKATTSRPIDPARRVGPTQSGMGRDPNVFSSWLDGSGLNPLDALIEFVASYPQPSLLGQAQHDWEPPRVAVGVKDQAPRLKALGNAVNPLQIFPIMYAIKVIDDWSRRGRG